ncbi:hypothetical protein P152DRAFT_448274 [Eremomyces bilateralis CBS 781.70]|uniref:Uncharacterized protein n=1 Tax=Eremomyces bilateralis CBS 781.70 TaxID=1392243 RepID=A0A6G1G7R3_9PEZI|nr:uncharacterized protein P152DRAFT_448274 [Eremomyces bilateralis CBS 781.70]KAF1813889.1 hypothetical protein P152DRAFT_448274 [Eremomyces bilateralis CBS 781.70]
MVDHDTIPDSPSVQLNDDLSFAIIESLQQPQPLLHHLNADSSWLLQIPRPASARRHGGRVYYNILVDPWLDGPQSDVASWFSRQWHATPSKVKSILEVEELVMRVETFARKARDMKEALEGPSLGGKRRKLSRGRRTLSSMAEVEDDDIWNGGSVIDVVAISHEFTDHCHKETLLQLDREVPVFAATNAFHLIKSWDHFHFVAEIPRLRGPAADYQVGSLPPLPEWLAICRVEKEDDALYYHSALLFAFSIPPTHPDTTSTKTRTTSIGLHTPSSVSSKADDEAVTPFVLYTPHGIHSSAVEILSSASPPLKALCLLHGLHDIFLRPTNQLNLGGHNALATQRILKADYWMPTHDEVKIGGGVVAWLLRRKIVSLEEALKTEAKHNADNGDNAGNDPLYTSYQDVNNGESKILEW